MSYFEDQMDAWEDNGYQGDPSDIDPDQYWINKIENCKHKFTKGVCKHCGLNEDNQ